MKKWIYIVGPCAAETEEQVMETARAVSSQLSDISGQVIFRAGIWKPRTQPDTFQGIGDKGLEWLARVRDTLGVAVATEVATPEQVQKALATGIDYLWIGARTSANPIAVQEIVDTIVRIKANSTTSTVLKGVMIKNPVNNDAALWIGNIERVEKAGLHAIAIHRGCGHNPCWEMAYTLRKQRPDLQLLMDPSHMSGDAGKIEGLCHDAHELEYDGIMVEVHPHPAAALSDKQQQITPEQWGRIMQDAGCKMQNAECKMQNAKCKMQNAECKRQNAKCKMQNAKCKMQNAECKMQNAECKMQNAECKMQNAKCKMQNAKCKMQNAECKRQNAECKMQNAECKMQNAECKMQNAECKRQNAECKMQKAKCKMQNAKCKMQNAECKMQNAECKRQNAKCKMQKAEGERQKAEGERQDGQVELKWLRHMIDEVDDRLWQSIQERMNISRQIGAWKKQTGMQIVQPARYKEILHKRKTWAQDVGIDENVVETIFEQIHKESVRVQS